MSARLVKRAIRPVGRRLTLGPIRPVGFAPQRTLPVARLAQQIVPLDLLIVRRFEEVDIRRHVLAREIIHVANEAALPREADYGRQERFRDAERHVDALWLAPLGDDIPVTDDEAVGGRARFHGADGRVERLVASEGRRERQGEISRARRLARDGELHRIIHAAGVHSHLVGFFMLPVEPIREVRRRLRRARKRRPLHGPLRRER